MNEIVAKLREYNRWRRGDEGIAQPDPGEIGKCIDAICDMVDVDIIRSKMSTPTPETDNLARGNHVVPTEWAEQLERELAEAREKAERYRIEANAMMMQRDEARGHCESIVDKANELIARWDMPSWKDTAPTARYINALRIAVRAYEKGKR